MLQSDAVEVSAYRVVPSTRGGIYPVAYLECKKEGVPWGLGDESPSVESRAKPPYRGLDPLGDFPQKLSFC